MTDHTTAASYTAATATATWGLFTAQEWGLIIGTLCAIATAGVNAYYRRQDRKGRAQLEALDRQIKEAELAIRQAERERVG